MQITALSSFSSSISSLHSVPGNVDYALHHKSLLGSLSFARSLTVCRSLLHHSVTSSVHLTRGFPRWFVSFMIPNTVGFINQTELVFINRTSDMSRQCSASSLQPIAQCSFGTSLLTYLHHVLRQFCQSVHCTVLFTRYTVCPEKRDYNFFCKSLERMGIENCNKIASKTTVSVTSHCAKSVYRLKCKSRAILGYRYMFCQFLTAVPM